MQPLKGGDGSIDLDDQLVRILDHFRRHADRAGKDDAAVFRNPARLNQPQIKTPATLLGIETIGEILSIKGEVLIAHAHGTVVDLLLHHLAALVGPAFIGHEQARPTVFDFRADGGTDEEIEAHLPLQIILLHIVGQGQRHHLGITDRGEARPAEVHPVTEKGDRILRTHDAVMKIGSANSFYAVPT